METQKRRRLLVRIKKEKGGVNKSGKERRKKTDQSEHSVLLSSFPHPLTPPRSPPFTIDNPMKPISSF